MTVREPAVAWLGCGSCHDMRRCLMALPGKLPLWWVSPPLWRGSPWYLAP